MRFRVKSLTDVRKEITTGQPFDITYCTYDERRQTGGERKTLEQCTLVKGSGEKAPADEMKQPGAAAQGISRNPYHLMNGTFNVKIKGSTEVRKIHWLLIEMFNGFQVVM